MNALVQWWEDLTTEEDLDQPASSGIDGPAWIVSLLANLSVIVILGTVFMRAPERPTVIEIVTEAEPEHPDEEIVVQQFRYTEEELPTIGSPSVLGSAIPTPLATKTDAMVSAHTELRPVEIARFDAPMLSEVSTAPTISDKIMMKGNAGVGAVGAVGAVDRITQEILLSLERRPTLVVWMFDQSWSMLPQRQAIHDRFERVYKELGVSHLVAASQAEKPLLTSVMAFGKDVTIRTPELTDDLTTIQNAVQGIENDESGVEMTFTAVTKAVETYRVHHQLGQRRNIMVVVFTDEVGDDEERLESTIALCRNNAIPVYVVGAPAPFGRRNIEFKYVDPDPNFDQREQWIPVRSGPETLLPEMINIGFVGFNRRDADIYRMDSGFGPYCLTRLCFDTGGIFFAVHPARPESAEGFVPSAKTPAMSARINYFFDPAIMRPYMPDYLPGQEYVRRISANKAKRALVQAAEMSMLMPMDSPRLVFERDPSNEAALKGALDVAQKSAAILEPQINQLYDVLRQGESDRPKLTESRWQAGFDLAMARLLAIKVRTEGYNFMLARAKGGIKYENLKSNLLELKPTNEVSWSSAHQKMANTAQELLAKIVREHAGTPWAKFAEVELNEPIGWRWQERFIPPPPAPPTAAAAAAAANNAPLPKNNPRPPLPKNANPKPLRQNIKL